MGVDQCCMVNCKTRVCRSRVLADFQVRCCFLDAWISFLCWWNPEAWCTECCLLVLYPSSLSAHAYIPQAVENEESLNQDTLHTCNSTALLYSDRKSSLSLAQFTINECFVQTPLQQSLTLSFLLALGVLLVDSVRIRKWVQVREKVKPRW